MTYCNLVRLTTAAALVLSVSPARGLDLDGDGIDDLYAARFGVIGGDPDSDQDGDGSSLRAESLFETDPTDPTDRPELRIAPGDPLRLTWLAKGGVSYTLQESGDLEGWLPFGPLRFGADSFADEPIEAGNAPRFFRLAASPLDVDRDGIRDLDEVALGTDPHSPDSDGDGLGDGFEVGEPSLDPLNGNDPCADVNGNGKPDIEDFAASFGALVVSWIAPGDGDWNMATNWSTQQIPGAGDVVLLASCSAAGSVVTVSAPAQASAILGQGSLVIDGTTLELGSYLALQSLDLQNGASLKPIAAAYAKLHLALDGDLSIGAGSDLQVENVGYPVGEGPGTPDLVSRAGTGSSGGGHGGRGGRGRFTNDDELGGAYGSITEPVTMGSGANRGRGAGGGALRIVVGGNLTVDGSLRADAVRDRSSGAGGSVWIDCATLAGNGMISAVGAGGVTLGGSGAGGRIAIYYDDDSQFAGALLARAGENGNPGGAGSIYTRQRTATRGTVLFSNLGIAGDSSDGRSPIPDGDLALDADLVVGGGAIVTSVSAMPLNINTGGGDVTIQAGSAIDVSAQGYPGRSRAGVGELVSAAGTGAIGGSHGGQGGTGRLIGDRSKLGAVYGSITAPVEFGSGSSRGEFAGGGAIRLQCANLSVGGLVAANGEDGGGSGAGGSLWITCDDLSGAGLIQANGGRPVANSGGGGGGRVAIYYDSRSAFTGLVEARADNSGVGIQGGAGSVYLQEFGAPRGLLRYQNGGVMGGLTPLVGSELMLPVDLEIDGGARLSNLLGDELAIEVLGDVHIGPGGGIDLVGRGYAPYQGPGAPPRPEQAQIASGAGHAGFGGRGWLVAPQSDQTIYGLLKTPGAAGSGAASWGGGALRLTADAVILDGLVDAGGEAVGSPNSSGSGGSIYIICDDFSGSGHLAASGGRVNGPQVQLGGSGSGGRIAVHAATATFAGTFEAISPDENSGGAGTIYLDFGGVSSLTIDNGGNPANEKTALPRLTELTGDFVVRGGARVSRVQDLSNPILEVVAGGNVEIAADGRIEYPGQPLGVQVAYSFSEAEEPGDPSSIGGGSHGGGGGFPRSPGLLGMGSYVYDSPYNPRLPGSGPNAGGVVILSAGQTATIEGMVAADAHDVPDLGPAVHGSSGGAILISAERIEGGGILSAVGGSSHTDDSDFVFGGGGGGRIAAYGNSVSDRFTLRLDGGAGDATSASLEEFVQSGQQGSFVRACFPLNQVTGAVTEIAPPSDLRPDARESATEITLFPEHLTFAYSDFDAGQFFTFDAVGPGTYDSSSDLVPTLDGKQVWTTYLLHADPPAGNAPVLSGSVTFDRDIIGVFVTAQSVADTNPWFGSQTGNFFATYTATAGIELDSGDSFTISPDRRTLTVSFDLADGMDQLRVVTQARRFDEWCP